MASSSQVETKEFGMYVLYLLCSQALLLWDCILAHAEPVYVCVGGIISHSSIPLAEADTPRSSKNNWWLLNKRMSCSDETNSPCHQTQY